MILILLRIAGLLVVAGIAAGTYFYKVALDPHSEKEVILEAPHNTIQEGVDLSDQSGWLDQAGAEDAWTFIQNGPRLHALVIRQGKPSRNWAILAHGYNCDGRSMAWYARHYWDLGFHVLLPDARGAGKSHGHYIGMGWHDRLDYVQWTREVTGWDPDARIILHGVSMGGAAVMMLAGEELPTNVAALVEDCGYTSVKAELAYQLKKTFHLPAFPLIHFASLITWIRAGFWLKEGDAIAQLKKTRLPILFIHGDRDTFVPTKMVHEAYEAAAGEKKLLVVSGAGHAAAAYVDPQGYWGTVEGFLNRYL